MNQIQKFLNRPKSQKSDSKVLVGSPPITAALQPPQPPSSQAKVIKGSSPSSQAAVPIISPKDGEREYIPSQPLVEQKKLPKSELLKPIKSFAEATDPVALFLHKLRLCSITFEWVGPDTANDVRAKDVKRQQLLELMEEFGKNKEVLTPEVLEGIVNMVAANLFRPLPPRPSETGSTGRASGGETEEDDPVLEPSWPHLQIVYEFFLRFIVSAEIDIKTLKKYINADFVVQLLALFDSEDQREREYLKTILHRIYAKFMALRAFIRKAINNVFWSFIYESGKHNGITELLEILGSIINGFALPLKAEHKNFLCNVLTPMHKVKGLQSFHQQLQYCVTQFVDKDPTLAVPVLSGLLKYWPVTNSSKEVLYLNELEELLELTQQQEFKILLKPLFTQLSRSIGSSHFQVAERALFLWHNEYISGLIADHRKEILPIIYPVLHENSESHWNLTVKNLTFNVMKIFVELDAEHMTHYVDESARIYQERKKRREQRLKLQREEYIREQAELEAKEEKERAARDYSLIYAPPSVPMTEEDASRGFGDEESAGDESVDPSAAAAAPVAAAVAAVSAGQPVGDVAPIAQEKIPEAQP